MNEYDERFALLVFFFWTVEMTREEKEKRGPSEKKTLLLIARELRTICKNNLLFAEKTERATLHDN